MESKIGIARAAADMIRDGQVVLIDGGTTNLKNCFLPFKRAFATIVLQQPTACAGVGGSSKLSVLMLGEIFLKRRGSRQASRPFVESNPFALIYVFSNVQFAPGGRNNRRRPRRRT